MNIIQEFSMKYEALQKNFQILQQREEGARINLVESQSKWKIFAQDLVRISNIAGVLGLRLILVLWIYMCTYFFGKLLFWYCLLLEILQLDRR